MKISINWYKLSLLATICPLVALSWHGAWTRVAHGAAVEWHWRVWQALALLVSGLSYFMVGIAVLYVLVEYGGRWLQKASEAPLVEVKRKADGRGPTVF